MNMRAVTENDIRKPEFVGAKLEDLEFRSDGQVVRKDRWERGIRSLVNTLGLNQREFEIQQVTEAVETLMVGTGVLSSIGDAVDAHYQALVDRAHGGLAAHELVHKIETALGKSLDKYREGLKK